VFLGEFQHSLDAKGRVILPSRFRTHLESGCVLTKGRESCVVVYPREEFEKLVRRLGEIEMSNRQLRNARRVLFSGASEQVPDGQGRVLIPENLRGFAGLERDLMITGHGERFEIWDRARWTEHMDTVDREFAEPGDGTPELPF
jgi:transcriptional regulator MraZ